VAQERVDFGSAHEPQRVPGDVGVGLIELATPLVERWKLLVIGPLLAGAVTLGLTYLIAPTFTARTTFLLPQQQQSVAAAALSQLGGLAGLVGGSARTPADQYVALMQSVTVLDRLVDQFNLQEAYETKFRVDTRNVLERNSRITVGKKDGLVSVEVDDISPQRAADIANRYVDELRRLTTVLAVSEAQQRRAFFERELKATRDQLTAAQQSLQASGFSEGALKAEPRAAADNYARLRAEVAAADVRLKTLRGSLADQAPEMRTQLATLAALRAELARAEAATQVSGGPDYISKYREFKYQETLFDLFARQYELARVDESREGALIQVLDPAVPPERKSKPRRRAITFGVALGALLLISSVVLVRHFWRRRVLATS
jgi:uncharacterized protein involved in exopolysaccharide biosynthesis